MRTDEGDVEAEIVINCAGQWAKQIGAMCGVTVPLHSAEHFYVVTDQIAGVHRDLPVLRDPDGYTYVKEEVGGLLVGGFEPDAKPWVAPDELPHPFEFQLLAEDWDHFAILMDSAIERIPALASTGMKKLYNGPESFTPDNQFILGEAPELRNFFVAAGFNSVGIASAGGAGRALADWIIDGDPGTDLSVVDIRRFAAFNGNNRWLRDRVGEVLGLHYAPPWPNRELVTARPFRRSPAYHLLRDAGACFGSKMGWERANVFAPAGQQPVIEYSWDKPNWLAVVGRRAARDQAGGGGLRPDLVLQVPGDRAAGAGGPAVAVHRRRRRAARPHRLHRHAERGRPVRGRHHRDQAGRRRVPDLQQRRVDRAGSRPHPQAAPAGWRAGRGRDLGVRGLRGDGAAVAGAAVPG